MKLNCECRNYAVTGPHDTGQHHHVNCQKYATEKFPYLMYWEEGIDAWTHVPKKVEGELIVTEDQLYEGDTMEIRFKRVDLTDKEYAEMPEE